MAHQLDFTNGRASVFSVRESMWHREGIVLADAPKTVEEALTAANINWNVVKRPVFLPTESGDFVEASGFKAITREDKPFAPFAVLPNTYTPLQNRDAFAVFQPLLDNGLASFETAGALRGGRDIWALVRLDLTDEVVQEVYADLGLLPYGLLTNNHGGQRAVRLGQTTIRVVCANTERMAVAAWDEGKAASIKVPHRRNVEARLTEAAMSLWQGILRKHRAAAEQYRLLRATYLDEALFRELVLDVALPEPTEEPTSKRGETMRDRLEDRRASLTRLWQGGGTGLTGDGSAWEAYNAVTEAMDHGVGEVWPLKGERSRIQSAAFGSLATLNQQVLEGLVAYGREQHAALVPVLR